MPTDADATATNLLVVDASAVLTLLIDSGPDGELVGRRMAHATCLAPDLLPYEVANVLRRRRNAGLLSPKQAALAFDDLAILSIELWPWQTFSESMWRLGANLSSYDAAYVALAEATSATLLTRDAHLAAAPGIRCRVDVV